jgi:hypothetical protein
VRGIFPLAVLGKRNLGNRTLPLILAGVALVSLTACGGGSNGTEPSGNPVVKGAGFRFEAPLGWTIKTTPTLGEARQDAAGTALTSATVFTLQKPYNPSLFPAAAKELDRVAAKLAAQSKATLTESQTVTVDGQRVRAYRLAVHPASGGSFDERIGFVLRGRREYQLLCRAPAGSSDPDGACSLLYATFTTSPLPRPRLQGSSTP